jgi:hypothetical protein
MKKLIILLVLVIFSALLLPIPAQDRVEQDNPGYQTNIYLEYAKKTANWLKSLAIAEVNGAYKWPTTESSQNSYTIGIDSGAAGVGMFFLELYNITKDREYLEYAEGSGRYLLNYHFKDGQVDWLNGAAGAGHYLIDLWKTTNNPSYLDKAQQTGNWLITRCSRENGGYFWVNYINPSKIFTGYAHGTAGIGDFFARLYDVGKDLKYLDYARGGGKWLQKEAEIIDDDSFRWPHYPGLPHDTGLLTGTAGVGNTFAISYSYDPQSDNNYLEYAKGSAHWLMSAAEFPSIEQLKWINYVEPEDLNYGEKEYQTAWYAGASGVGLFFLNLSQTLPPPLSGNLAPVLNPIGNKTIRADQRLSFSISGHDPDESPGPLTFIAGNLPRGALFKDKYFSWTPGLDQAGTYDVYFMVTDGWDADWEHVTINVTKLKKGKIKR